jgi:EAL and modified HD-GYP domain-containing signal transduction protein
MAETGMQEHPVLGQVALGYSPMIDRQRSVIATRLTVFPEHPELQPDANALLAALDEVWPPVEDGQEQRLAPRPLNPREPTAAARRQPLVSLNVASESLLQDVMLIGPGQHRMLEVPAFMACDPAQLPLLKRLHGDGAVMLIKGRPLVPLTAEVLGCFAHSIVELADDRRSNAAPPPGVRVVSSVYAGARTLAEAATCFERGAVAILGWQFDDPLPAATGRPAATPDLQVVFELINGVDAELPVGQLEAILKRDPTLGFKLMRYLNSPAFGMSVEINSFGHAVMLLGYQRLKRWLVLLLASSAKEPGSKPVMHASVRRGMIMEELVRGQRDSELSGEMFICGVFSLLDRLLMQPFEQLLDRVPVPDRVQQALRGEGGPYLPYLELVRAIENASLFDIRECAEQLFLSPMDINTALLRALRAARHLD